MEDLRSWIIFLKKTTTTDIIENARQMRKFLIIIENVFEILGIDDGVSQTKLFKLTDIELSGRMLLLIPDNTKLCVPHKNQESNNRTYFIDIISS